jgi:glycosyltransferase involved in cell wall biosynthesis
MKLFISTDLMTDTSGDIVATKELEAIQLLVSENNEKVIILNSNDIAPTKNGLPDIPFLIDYLTLERLSNIDLSDVDLAHMYGGSYTQTVKFLKAKDIKTTYSCMMHDRKISIEEYEKLIGSYPFPHVKDDRLWPFYIGAIKEADIVITPGKAPKELLIKEGAKRVEIIPHGCDIPSQNNIKPFPEEFRIGYLGALGPDKGLIYLIQAWSKLNYTDSTLIFAGNGTDQLQPLINRYAIRGKFHLTGYLNHPSELYNNISVYVQPSATEAFGMEVTEVMSYGRPVIVSDGAGSSDVITNGIDGFIVPKRNPDAIADKINWCYNHQKELITMSKNAREKSKQFNWNIIKNGYVNLWKSLLNKDK